ncbi:MAG: STAS domain-containing protein [Spirochaetes bacterium]|nr:STAS domain-containing protein [Spirochaetota bacterium]
MAIPIHDLSTPDLIRIRIEAPELREALTLEVKERVKALLDEEPREIRFDLSAVQSIESLAIGMLLYFEHIQKRAGLGMRIEAASPALTAMLGKLALGHLIVPGA